MLLSSIVALNCYAKEPQMSETKTYCIGRYLVDLPADAQINGQAYMYRFGLIETDASIETALAFQQKMDEREVELRGGKHKKRYALVGVRRPSSTIRIFELSTELIVGSSAGFGAYVWDDGRTFSMEETAYDPAVFGDILAELQERLLPHLRARSPDDIPTEPGFCLKDGFIGNDGTTPQFEDAAITFKFAQWPGVLVSIESTTVTKPGEPALLQRVDSSGVWETFKDVVSQIAPTAPLGTLGQTGTTCPQTGWWTCPEATANEIESPPAATPG